MAEEYTPKSKIAKLKRDIQQLDQRVYECTTDRPIYHQVPIQDLKTERLSADKGTDAGLLETQANQLREQLLRVQQLHQDDLSSHQKLKSKLMDRIKSTRASLSQLQLHLSELKKQLEGEQAKSEVLQRMKIAKMKKEVQIQEREKEVLIERLRHLQEMLTMAEDGFSALEEGKKMCFEEMWGLANAHEEYVAEREEMEERLEHFLRTYQATVQDLVTALWSVHTHKRILSKRSAISAQFQSVENRLSSLNGECFLVLAHRETLLRRLSELMDPHIDDQVKDLERRIGRELGDSSVLEKTVSTLNANAGFDIDEQILRVQIQIVERRTSTLEKESNLDSMDLGERVLEAQDAGDQSQSSLELRESRLLSQAESLKRTQINQSGAVSQWLKEAKGILQGKDQVFPLLVSDEVILDDLKTRFRAQFKGEKSAFLEKIVQDYFQLLQKKEERMQTSEYRQVQANFQGVTQDLYQIMGRQKTFQLEKSRLRSELLQLSIRERKLTFSEADLTHPLYQQADLLIERLTYWETLAEDTTFRLKSQISVYRDIAGNVVSSHHRRDDLRQELELMEFQVRESQSKLDILNNSQKSEFDRGETLDSGTKTALADVQEEIVQKKQHLEMLELEQDQLDSDWTQKSVLFAREETDLQIELQALIKIQPSFKEGKINAFSVDLEGEKPSVNLRTSVELQGTARSRSLLRASAHRMPSRSPIQSREQEDLMELLDLDDDLDLLLETQYQEPIKQNLPEGLTQEDRDFFEKVMPLLDGGELYKKYSQMNSLKQKAFDPLLATEDPPEACGFGPRIFRLSWNLMSLEIKQGLKSIVESTLLIDQIQAPVIPQSTMSILKTQKKLLRRKQTSKLPLETVTQRYKDMKDGGFVNVNSPIFEAKCRECTMYPFSIVLTQNGRIEVIASTYYAFKTWVNGLNALVKRKGELVDLQMRLKANRRWV